MDAESHEIRQARQRASVKWLLSKAYNNRVPDNMREPFYHDHDNQERLKPQIIVELGNATLYCQSLSNLYSDPNYQNLNHWSILQTLARKGVAVDESPDMPLTETVLIQTNPLKLNAHMAVIESLMLLYAKEVTSGERIVNAIRRISGNDVQLPQGQSSEQSLLLWVSYTCAALKKRIEREIAEGVTDENGGSLQAPDIPPVHDFQNLCDGVCLALLISYYCPKLVPWTNVRINYLPAVEDSVHNVLLVNNFSQKHLPYNVFHMMPEDVTYMRGSMKINLLVLLADLFNLFEVNPAKCVCYPDMNSEAFVVHKSRGITTLSSMHQQKEPLVPARLRQLKEKSHTETKADERGDNVAAGKPSNWEQNRRSSYAGRRSRRNSSSEDSQLTIENFGGSQDQLNTIGGCVQRERDRERKLSNVSIEPSVAVRSSISDSQGTFQLGYDTDSGSEKQDHDTEKHNLRRQAGGGNMSPKVQITNSSNATSPMPPTQEQHSIERNNSMGTNLERKTSQSNIPAKSAPWQTFQNDFHDEDIMSSDSVSKLSSIRMKLEEKRSRIEQDKRKIELALLRQQEKLAQEDVDVSSDTLKWETLSNDSSRTPEIDPRDLERYQQSIAAMNMNLKDIQQDIQRLTIQQNQIQTQQLEAQMEHALNQQQLYGSQQHIPDHFQQRTLQHQNFGSTPHLPYAFNTPTKAYNSRPPSRDMYQQMSGPPTQYVNEHGQYMSSPAQQQTQTLRMQQSHYVNPHSVYNADMTSYSNPGYSTPQYMQPQYINQPPKYDEYGQPQYEHEFNSPQPNQYYVHEVPHQSEPQRRIWNLPAYEQQQQQQQYSIVDMNPWQLQKKQSAPECHINWKRSSPPNMGGVQQGFVVQQDDRMDRNYQQFYYEHSSPQAVRENPEEDLHRRSSMISLRDNRSPNAAKIPNVASRLPSDDIMTPQSICFIGDEEDVDEIERNIIESMQTTRNSADNVKLQQLGGTSYGNDKLLSQKMNITSGNLTYRIPSPLRPPLTTNSFQDPRNNSTKEKGFYISFDDNQPKRPKPPLRAKRSSKKEKSFDGVDHQAQAENDSFSKTGLEDNDRFMESAHNNDINIPNNKALENKGTYNKYTDSPIHIRQIISSENNSPMESHQLDKITNQQFIPQPFLSPKHHSQSTRAGAAAATNEKSSGITAQALVIGTDPSTLNPESMDEMERRKEKIMLLSLQRRQQQEEAKARKEIEAAQRREREREKEEMRARKKEEQMAKRAAILEQHRLKKAIEEAEREGKTLSHTDLSIKPQSQSATTTRLRQQRNTRPRPKTIHVDDGSINLSNSRATNRSKKDTSINLTDNGILGTTNLRRDFYRGSQDSLAIKESPDEYPSTSSTPIGRRTSCKTSIEPIFFGGTSRISFAKGNLRGQKSNSLINLRDTDSGLGSATPPRRAPSPSMAPGRHMPSPSGPGSLPPGLLSKRRGFEDGSSDISSIMEYSGPKLYKQPAAKSNRGIILNAVEYCVFPGAVNREAKQKVLEKIARSEAKHFLVLFRDAGCQFRALYSYTPETEQVCKLYGTGPSQVDEVMFDKFFKYNSGGKCFSQVHTKHLTVTIDAFTIHNSLWQGKKVHLPSKKDMTLVI